MKISKLCFFFLSIIVLLNSCCKSKDEFKTITIETTYPIPNKMEIDQDPNFLDSLISRETYEFPTSIMDQTLRGKGTNRDMIISAKLVDMNIFVTDLAFKDSSGTRYSNLKDLKEIYLDFKQKEIGQFEAAKQLNIPDGYWLKNVKLETTNRELSDLFQKESFSFVIKYKKKRLMPHDMPFVLTIKFRVVARILSKN